MTCTPLPAPHDAAAFPCIRSALGALDLIRIELASQPPIAPPFERPAGRPTEAHR